MEKEQTILTPYAFITNEAVEKSYRTARVFERDEIYRFSHVTRCRVRVWIFSFYKNYFVHLIFAVKIFPRYSKSHR